MIFLSSRNVYLKEEKLSSILMLDTIFLQPLLILLYLNISFSIIVIEILLIEEINEKIVPAYNFKLKK